MGRAMDIAQMEIGKEFAGLGALLPDWVPTPGRARIRKAAAVIDAEVRRVVARHRGGEEERPDLLSRLLTAVDESGTHLSDEEIRDEAVTLYIGGHETTSTTLVWRGTCSPATPASATRSPRSWTGCSATGSRASRTTHNCTTPRPW